MTSATLFKWMVVWGLLGITAGAAAQLDIPNNVEAYQPFTLSLSRAHVRPPHDYVFVDVKDNVIVVGHKNRGHHFPVEPNTPPMSVEIQGVSPGEYSFSIVEMPYSPGGEAQVYEDNAVLIIPETPPPVSVYALFHENIKHYFVTASQHEASTILGQGWVLVDMGFNAWPAAGPAPRAAVSVCRFYSAEVNSHFYTADETECKELQDKNGAWRYEGIAFRALRPIANACPVGTDPVWRLYNNRFAEMDSNHRFVSSSETYRTMVASGWTGEGVAFCSPPLSAKG